jgi:glycosyltransferase involved in cell wall biosynthesis/Flp pilus assembly protein TadD
MDTGLSENSVSLPTENPNNVDDVTRVLDRYVAVCRALGAELAFFQSSLAKRDAALGRDQAKLHSTNAEIIGRAKTLLALQARLSEIEHTRSEWLSVQDLVAATRQELKEARCFGERRVEELEAALQSAQAQVTAVENAGHRKIEEFRSALSRAEQKAADRNAENAVIAAEIDGLRSTLAATRQVGRAAVQALMVTTIPALPVEQIGRSEAVDHLRRGVTSAAPQKTPKRRWPSTVTLADHARDCGQWERATALYRKVLVRNPRNPPIWVQLGHALKESGRFSEAEAAYRQAVAYDSRHADGYLHLGHLLKVNGNTEAAQASYLQSFLLDPAVPDARQELRCLDWSETSIFELRQAMADALRADPARDSGAINPIFSVVVPIHDRTWELRDALDSVLSQSMQDFEIIIVTDATPPETMKIVDEYACKDRRIRTFFYTDHSGNACRGRNRGIIEARGEFISFLDSDDQYFPDTLEKAHRAFREHQVDFVCGHAYFIVDGTRHAGNLATGSINEGGPINISRFLRGENPIQTCSVHIRRDLLLKYGGFRIDQRYLEDLELWTRLAYYNCRFYYTDELLAKYRLHQGNLELKFIENKEYWLELMKSNYLRPFEDWGTGPTAEHAVHHEGRLPDTAPVWPGRVDAQWYLQQYADVARSGADPLDHFIECGRAEGRKPNAAEAQAAGWTSVADVEIVCLKQPVFGSEIALFVTHSPHGRLKPHVRHYIECLTRHGVSVILIVAADKPFTGADADLTKLVDGFFVRQNYGYDFAAWAHIIRLYPKIYNSNILFLLNDSVFGPTNDTALSTLLKKIRHSSADCIGLTESFEGAWHLQSYFLVLKGQAVVSDAFRAFIEVIVCYPEIDKVIAEYEMRLSAIMKIAGFSCEAVFRKTDFRNPVLFHWRHLLESGFPFLKARLLRDPSFHDDVADWRQVLASLGYDVSLAEGTLREISGWGIGQISAPSARPSSAVSSISQLNSESYAIRKSEASHRTPSLRILIFAHELSESGAPRAVFDVARVLRCAGHSLVCASRSGGPYQERLHDIGVDVIVDEQLYRQDGNIVNLAHHFDKVICNTIVCWPIVEQLRDILPVYWFVHENESIHALVRSNPRLLSVLRSGVTFVAPCALTASALAVYGVHTHVVEYGVEDLVELGRAAPADPEKVIIGIFGSYEFRKGQDLAVAGMLCVPKKLRDQAQMRFYGRTLDRAFRRNIEQIASKDSSITFFDEIDNEVCRQQMAASDIIVLPSRDDPLPFVSLDALSLGKVLVCSTTTGIAAYITSGRSGLLLSRNTAEEIGVTLGSAISNADLRQALGCGARQVYEETFTEQMFASKILPLFGSSVAPTYVNH